MKQLFYKELLEMKNKTLAVILLLCTMLMPSGFAGEIRKNSPNYRNMKIIKSQLSGQYYAVGTLRMLSDKFNELLDLLKKEKDKIELDSKQKIACSKDMKFLFFTCYYTKAKTVLYGQMYAQELFKGLDDFMYHPMYMLINPGSGLNFGWLTYGPSSKFADMLNTFVENIHLSEEAGYFDDVHSCSNYLKKISRLKLEQILKVKNFYTKFPKNSENALVVFENIIFIIRRFGIRKNLAVKHLELVVKYAKTQENKEELLKKIRNIVTNNIRTFANSVEEMALIQLKIR